MKWDYEIIIVASRRYRGALHGLFVGGFTPAATAYPASGPRAGSSGRITAPCPSRPGPARLGRGRPSAPWAARSGPRARSPWRRDAAPSAGRRPPPVPCRASRRTAGSNTPVTRTRLSGSKAGPPGHSADATARTPLSGTPRVTAGRAGLTAANGTPRPAGAAPGRAGKGPGSAPGFSHGSTSSPAPRRAGCASVGEHRASDRPGSGAVPAPRAECAFGRTDGRTGPSTETGSGPSGAATDLGTDSCPVPDPNAGPGSTRSAANIARRDRTAAAHPTGSASQRTDRGTSPGPGRTEF